MQCLKLIIAETVLFKLSDSKGKEKEKRNNMYARKIHLRRRSSNMSRGKIRVGAVVTEIRICFIRV